MKSRMNINNSTNTNSMFSYNNHKTSRKKEVRMLHTTPQVFLKKASHPKTLRNPFRKNNNFC